MVLFRWLTSLWSKARALPKRAFQETEQLKIDSYCQCCGYKSISYFNETCRVCCWQYSSFHKASDILYYCPVNLISLLLAQESQQRFGYSSQQNRLMTEPLEEHDLERHPTWQPEQDKLNRKRSVKQIREDIVGLSKKIPVLYRGHSHTVTIEDLALSFNEFYGYGAHVSIGEDEDCSNETILYSLFASWFQHSPEEVFSFLQTFYQKSPNSIKIWSAILALDIQPKHMSNKNLTDTLIEIEVEQYYNNMPLQKRIISLWQKKKV